MKILNNLNKLIFLKTKNKFRLKIKNLFNKYNNNHLKINK